MKDNRDASAPAASRTTIRALSAISILKAFGYGSIEPLIDIYMVKLNPSPVILGWFWAINKILLWGSQIPWGLWSDRVGKRVPFLLLCGLAGSLLYIPIFFATSAEQFIALMAIHLFVSGTWSVWNALLGRLTGFARRGGLLGRLGFWRGIGGSTATLLAGYLMGMWLGLPFFIAAGLGFAGSLLFLFVKEPTYSKPQRSKRLGVRDMVGGLRSQPLYLRYLIISIVYWFFFSIPWPLVSLIRVDTLRLSPFEISILHVSASVVSTALIPLVGRLLDRVGRRPLIILGQIGFAFFPVLYALSTGFLGLLLAHILAGAMGAFQFTAMSAYLIDITPEDRRASLMAFFQMFRGITYFTGSLASGYMAELLPGMFAATSIQMVLLISAVGRGVVGSMFVWLKEPHVYPSSLRKELQKLMKRVLARQPSF